MKCPGRKRSRGRPDTGGHQGSRPVMEGKGEMATPMPSFAAIRRRILSKGAGELPKAIISPSFSVSFRSSHGLLEERGLRRQSLLGISFHVGRPRSVVRVPVCLEISPDPPVLLGSGVGKEAVEVVLPSREGHEGKGRRAGDGQGEAFQKGIPDSRGRQRSGQTVRRGCPGSRRSSKSGDSLQVRESQEEGWGAEGNVQP